MKLGSAVQVFILKLWPRLHPNQTSQSLYICQVLPDWAPSQNPPPTHPLIAQSLVFSLVLHRWFTCRKVTQWEIPTLSLYLVDSLAPSHWVIPTLSLNLVDSLAPSHYPTLWSLNPVVSLTPHTIHPLLKLLPFPFPLRCSSACLSFYSSSSPSPLLRLRLKRRLINTGNKFLSVNFPNKVTGRPSSLLYDHLVLL